RVVLFAETVWPATSAGIAKADAFEGAQSHASPRRSRSVSVWDELASAGELSQAAPTPSKAASFCAAFASAGQLAQASPTPRRAESAGAGLATLGQLSPDRTPSSSASPPRRAPSLDGTQRNVTGPCAPCRSARV